MLVGVDITSSIPVSHHSQRPSPCQIAHGMICRSHSYYQQYNNTRLILLLLQASSWPVGFHGIAIFAAGLSVIRGVATIEPVNKVIVPILLGIIVLSFYWALFLPYASEGIKHMFSPNWGT